MDNRDCYHCGQKGHIAAYCPQNPKGKGKGYKGKGVNGVDDWGSDQQQQWQQQPQQPPQQQQQPQVQQGTSFQVPPWVNVPPPPQPATGGAGMNLGGVIG